MDSMSRTVAVFHASQFGLENNHQNAEKTTLWLLRQKAAKCLGQGLPVKKESKGCLYREILIFSESMKITVNSFKAKFYCR